MLGEDEAESIGDKKFVVNDEDAVHISPFRESRRVALGRTLAAGERCKGVRQTIKPSVSLDPEKAEKFEQRG
jgi:hypothetical protein